MTNPYDLLDAIVQSLEANAALAAVLGSGPDAVVAYKHQWSEFSSWMLALRQLKPKPSILVLYRGTTIGNWGRIPSRQHNFSLLIRDGEGVDIAAIWTAIIDGGFRSAAEIHSNVDMVQDPSLELRTMPVTDTSYLDYWEAQFSLTERLS